jgi:hypothetical protein
MGQDWSVPAVVVGGVKFERHGSVAVATRLVSGSRLVLPAAISFGSKRDDLLPLRVLGVRAFARSAVQSAVIPKQVETLGSSCFEGCQSLLSVGFETDSQLQRIEVKAFSSSSLKSILIPRNVEILGSSCFSYCKSLSSILFESNSRLRRIESEAFLFSSLTLILIPRNVEILGLLCFSYCKSLSSISFESNSRLRRIESRVFSSSSLTSILIPRTVTSIDGSTFVESKISRISIEDGNTTFVIEKDLLLDFDHKTLIRYFGSSSSILIPRNIEILGSSCFSSCESLSSISFKSNSRLTRVEADAFAGTSVDFVLLPHNTAFIAGGAFSTSCTVSMCESSSCPEFIEWTSRRRFDSGLNFELPVRRKLMSEWVVDLSDFVLVRVIKEDSRCPVEIHRNRVNGNQIAVKCFPKLSTQDDIQKEIFIREIEALVRLDHRCIVPFFGYVLQVQESGPKLATHFMPGGSLADVLESNPSWFTGTAKSIVAAGIVIGMSSVHTSGIIHRDLKPSNILLDADRRPRISDFGSSRDLDLMRTLTGGGQVGTPLYMAPELYEERDYDEKIDVYSFALVLYEIVVGHPVFPPTLTFMQLCAKILRNERAEIPSNVEGLVADLIRRGWSSDPAERPSFAEIYEILRQNNFRITSDDFDASEVASYVTWAGCPR